MSFASLDHKHDMRIAESFGKMTATHCEYSLQRHLPNNTSWWTLCSPRSRSSASRAGQSPSHTFCGNTPSVSMRASVETGTEEMMTREISGRRGNESRHNHISCAACLSEDQSNKCLSHQRPGLWLSGFNCHLIDNSSSRLKETDSQKSYDAFKKCRLYSSTTSKKWFFLTSSTNWISFYENNRSAIKFIVFIVCLPFIFRNVYNEIASHICNIYNQQFP